jgi:hypothetical protein
MESTIYNIYYTKYIPTYMTIYYTEYITYQIYSSTFHACQKLLMFEVAILLHQLVQHTIEVDN